MLELKRGGRARVQTEVLEFIALPFPSSIKLEIKKKQKNLKCTRRLDAGAELLFRQLNLLLYDIAVAASPW